MLTILNTSILTSYGTYTYSPLSLAEAQALVTSGFQSAVGHQSTADIISTLLSVPCPVNRIQYQQQPGDLALIFKLNGRPEEGKILSTQEIEAIGYSWGVLQRIA